MIVTATLSALASAIAEEVTGWFPWAYWVTPTAEPFSFRPPHLGFVLELHSLKWLD